MAKKTSIGASIGLDGEKEFRQAISDINSDMKVIGSEMKKVTAEFSDNSNSIEALTKKDDVLNKQLDKQKEKVEALKAALQNAQDQYGENDAKTDKWKISLNNAEAEMYKLTKEVKDNKNAMEQAKNPTDKLGDEIGTVGKEAKEAGEKSLKMSDIIKANLISGAMIGGVKKLADAFTGVAGNIKDAVKETIDHAGELSDASKKTGVGTDALQEYGYAAKMSGMEQEGLEKAMIKSQTSFAKAKDGSKSLSGAYKDLGIDLSKVGNSGDAFDKTIAALADMKDKTKANSIASQLFGKSYADLAPLLSEGSKGINDLKGKAKDLGLVMSEDAVNSGENLGDTLDTLKGQVGGMANSIIGDLLPGLSDFANKGTKYLGEFSSKIKAANGDSGKIGEVIGSTLSDLAVKIAEKLPDIIEGAKSVITSFAKGIQENLPEIIKMGMQIITDLATSLIKALPEIIKTGLEIIISIANGIADALPTLIPTIVDVVLQIVDTLINNIDKLIDAALKIIMGLADGLIKAIPKLTKKIPTIIIKLVDAIVNNLPKIIEAGIQIIISLSEAIVEAIPELTKAMPKIIKAIVVGLFKLYIEVGKIGQQAVIKLWEGIKDKIGWVGDKVKDFGKGIVTGIKNGLSNIGEIGTNMIKGLWNGISDATEWIVNKIKGFTDDVLKAIKGFFGIHSPSTVFRDEVGKNLALGLGEGFTSTMQDLSADMNNSIPTDFSVNGAYNLSGSVNSIDSNMYNAFAAVATGILVPAFKSIGVNLSVEADTSGIFKIVQSKSREYYNMTGKSPFPV